ncbi:uncharacterized protein LOC130967269 [Arachis stenosperma]|uniref:uncharacterized protein LOC130967269 n=1 Tax=Arachis stenosperma TaxID=217475 RepID=UPI0025AB9E94|nr:uncharacterized protein LOC130967269 [Arachis stenosperma]
MESAMIRIHSSPLLLRLSNNGAKGSTYARSSILFFHNNNNNILNNHNQTSLCASEFARLLHPVFTTRSSSFCHPNCVPERSSSGSPEPPSNSGNKGRVVMRGMSGVCVVLACVLGLLNLKSNMNPMFKEAYAANPFGGVPAGAGKMAVAALFETTIKAKRTTKKPALSPGLVDVKQHKWYAVSQSIDGNKNAEKILEKLNIKGDDQEFDVQMATVELLILQEKFAKAKDILEIVIKKEFGSNQDGKGIIEKLNNEGPLINKNHAAQLILYKAIVLTMLNQNEEAAKWWKYFGDILSLDMSFN